MEGNVRKVLQKEKIRSNSSAKHQIFTQFAFCFFFFLFFLNRKSSPSGEAEILDFTVSAPCSVSLAVGRLMLAAC